MERWAGRVAVVTGASAGIGAAIAQELVKQGLRVVGLDLRVDRMEEMSQYLRSAQGKLYPLKCDVTKESDIKEAFKWVKSNLGGTDIHVNNAGVADYNSLIGGSSDSWRKIMEVNVLGYSICAKEALQSMREKGVDDGHIINISSETAHLIPPSFFMYTASKHAVKVLTEGLRRELVMQTSKIRVTSISPGVTRTGLVEASKIPKEMLEGLEDFPSLEPEEIANAVLYVLGAPPHVQIHELIIKPNGPTI